MIHILRDGQQFGPYSLEEINAFSADGSLLSSDQLGTKVRCLDGFPHRGARRGSFGTTLHRRLLRGVASGGSGKRKKLLIGIAGGVVVFGVLAFAGMHFLGGEKESEKPVGTSANKEKGVDGSVEMPRPRVGQ